VNVLVGVALVAVLVDVPVFARVTRYPDSQLGAALVLVQFLAALPVGALLGGWATRRIPSERIAATGMAAAAAGLAGMATWSADALDGPASSAVLVLAGLGFGLAVAPVNAVLLAATPAAVHGLASALAVLARTVGMLVGLSALTAVGLRVFFARQEQVGSPFTLCPQNPADCPAYVAATQASVLGELHAIFAGAAGTAAVAAVLCLILLRRRPPSAAPVPAPARSSRAA
jgi:MFS family permease